MFRKLGLPVLLIADRSRFVALALAIGVACASLNASEDQKSIAKVDVQALLKTAREALDRNDYAAAVKSLEEVVKAEPAMTAAWFNLGYAYTGLGRDNEAVTAYLKAVELQPDLVEAELNLGILLVRIGRAADSVPHLAKAVSLRPANPRAHLYLGRSLAATGKPDEALAQYGEALRLDPTLSAANFDSGQIYLSKKDYTNALVSFQKADPKLAQTRLGLALALEGLNRQPEAIPEFESYLAANPVDTDTRFHLARLYLQSGRNEQAYESLQTVYRADSKRRSIAAALGDVCTLLKRFAEAETYYREAVAASPDAADLHRALGQILLHLEKFTEAETEFRTCLKLDPRNSDALRGLGSSLYLEKRYPEAIPLLEAQARAPNPPTAVFFVLATCYDHIFDRQNALTNYERFLQLSQNQSPDQEWQARQRAKLLRRELRK